MSIFFNNTSMAQQFGLHYFKVYYQENIMMEKLQMTQDFQQIDGVKN